jgi:hypothetical protein
MPRPYTVRARACRLLILSLYSTRRMDASVFLG